MRGPDSSRSRSSTGDGDVELQARTGRKNRTVVAIKQEPGKREEFASSQSVSQSVSWTL